MPKAKARVSGHGLYDVRIPSTLDDGESIGIIKINAKQKQFNAHCCQLGQPGSCQDHRTPTMPECRMNRKARAGSKPLGFLVQWLKQAHAFTNHADHMISHLLISAEERREGRKWLRRQAEIDPNILLLLQKEAEFIGLPWIGVGTVDE